MSFWNKLFGKDNVKYSENTDLHPIRMNDINPFDDSKPPKKTQKVVIPVGGEFSYSDEVHGSVGVWWDSEYDESTFEMQSSVSYNDPQRCEIMCGADRAVRTETFKALKKGDFKVIIRNKFRGKVTDTTTIDVKVR